MIYYFAFRGMLSSNSLYKQITNWPYFWWIFNICNNIILINHSLKCIWDTFKKRILKVKRLGKSIFHYQNCLFSIESDNSLLPIFAFEREDISQEVLHYVTFFTCQYVFLQLRYAYRIEMYIFKFLNFKHLR